MACFNSYSRGICGLDIFRWKARIGRFLYKSTLTVDGKTKSRKPSNCQIWQVDPSSIIYVTRLLWLCSRTGFVRIATMSSPQLTNYLRTNRNRLALWQEEAAFLLGFKVKTRGKVCRDEKFKREPSLRSRWRMSNIWTAGSRIVCRPVSRGRTGCGRASQNSLLRKVGNQNPKRNQALANLASKPLHNPSQT